MRSERFKNAVFINFLLTYKTPVTAAEVKKRISDEFERMLTLLDLKPWETSE